MSKNKLKCDGIYFTGQSSMEVTGSQYLIRFGNYQCLFECGLYQSSSNNYLDSYRVNSEKFKFVPSEIDFVFLPHSHIDHVGLIPRLIKEGFTGKIITTNNTAQIIKPLLLNSCYIIADETRILSKKYKRNYKPLYEEKDVYETFNFLEIYDEYNNIYKLNDTISFQWLHNSHCIGATQIQLILNDGKGKVKKILYTSDIGSLNTQNHYVKNTEIPEMYNDVVIMESTYGDSKRISKKTRNFDISCIKSAIDAVISRQGTAIIPCFSFSRTQEILTTLYEIYKDEKFYFPIIVDSKLSCDICDLYKDILKEDDLNLWNNVCEWDRIKFIKDKENSRSCINNKIPKVVISSSGFCTNGRIINYLKQYLKDRNSMIIFSGYTGNNPSYLSYRIKNYRDNKYININKEKILNNADCISLLSFSSHANYYDLIKYGSSLNTNKLVLVHGSNESKKNLAKGLKEAISKNNKSYNVLSAFKGMVVYL